MAESSIQQQIDWARQALAATSPSAVLDAEVLLAHCLQKNRSFLRAWPELLLNDAQLHQFRQLITLRITGMPVAYLTGQREFWSRTFNINANVLIPRPDSELLIELSLKHLPADASVQILDLGVGSGILAVTLALERPLAHVLATDISLTALDIAKQNAITLNANNISFLASNWFEAVPAQKFDLIISNPPYIAADDPHLQQGDVRFEPDNALISGKQGLFDIEIIVSQAKQYLKPNAYLLIEHGYNQATAVQAIFTANGYSDIDTHPDLSGQLRVTSGAWTTS